VKPDTAANRALTALNDWAAELLEQGRVEVAREVFLLAAQAIGVAKGLTASKYSPKMGGMDTEHKEAISEGRSRRNPIMKAARKHGFGTLGELCEALKSAAASEKPPVELKVSPSFLSQIASRTKKLPPDLGRRLRDLIGWEPA